MRKSSVYLTEEQAERLGRLALEEGRPQAAILRDAITQYQSRGSDDREFTLDGCITGSGDSVADIDQRELMRGFGT